MNTHQLSFVASMTVCASDIRKICTRLEQAKPVVDPIKNILVTPLFMGKDALHLIGELASQGKSVTFDSGGYYVQTGKVDYLDLFYPLLRAYKNNLWASTYVLPDYVPTSSDDVETVEFKVRSTYQTSELFFHELPDDLKLRAMPVVHGHNYRQVDACLETYIRMGVKQVGFGSFGTSGTKQEVNVASRCSIEIARYVAYVAHQHGMKMHVFGLGVPAIVAMLKGLQVDSFDSSSWLKAAGFGQVFLPFMRAYNITYKTDSSEVQRGITDQEFNKYREITQHSCYFCENRNELRESKMARAIHNLIVIAETVDRMNRWKLDHIESIYRAGSPKYRDEVAKWLRS